MEIGLVIIVQTLLWMSQSWAWEILDAPVFGRQQAALIRPEPSPSTHRRNKRATQYSTRHVNPPLEISPLPRAPHPDMPPLSFRDIHSFVQRASEVIHQRYETVEPRIFNSGVRQIPGSAAWFLAASAKTKVVTKNISRIALISEEATKFIAQELKLSKEQVTYGLPTADVRGTVLGDECPVQVDFPCQPRKYRAYNGYCNNVQNPRWGNSNTRYLRFLPADYADGVATPRQSKSGAFLRSAREVSLALHESADRPHPHMTAIAALWAQLITHDLSHTPQMAGYLGQRLKCCGVRFEDFHPECYPIRLPDDDPVHSKLRKKCQEYARSGTAPRTGCTLGPREQINQVTSFIDGSVMYGSSREEVEELRTLKGGLLLSQVIPAGELLPPDENVLDCRANSTDLRCFKSGDVRVNEDLGLAGIHTILLREHNRVARILSHLNPHWNDETVFQESRRILGATLQHITYAEFLPVVLGQDLMAQYGLEPQSSGFFTGYDININPGVANSVASAALKFVASLMLDDLPFRFPDGRVEEKPIGKTFYAPFDLYLPDRLEALLQGMLDAHAQTEDSHIAESMTNHLFYDPETGVGLDLAAQIIQQGRDHGLGGYNAWREFCGYSRATSFSHFLDVMSESSVRLLQSIYENVEDVDLFSGGLAEVPNRGALVGPTFGCLLGRQFHYLRRGDRYWYENDLPPSSFSKDQLYEIRKTSLARLICDNTNIDSIQPHVFLSKDPFLNAVMACDGEALKAMNLKKWQTLSPNFIVPSDILESSFDRAKRDVGAIRTVEWDLYNQDLSADPKSPVGSAYGFLRPKRQALQISNTSFVLQFASARFVNDLIDGKPSHSKDLESGSHAPQNFQELMNALPNIDVTDIMEIPQVFECDEQTLPCDHTSRFPTLTGWCNNLEIPEYGKSMRAFARLLPAHYQDGLSRPRSLSVTGIPLPSPRMISRNIHDDVSAPHVRYTLITMQFAQFLDHDLTFTPVNKGFGNSILDCRRCDSQETVHPECFPIKIPDGDAYYPRKNGSLDQPFCIAFTRSLPGQLTLGYREQINQVTAFLDASAVYGSDVCESRGLRSGTRGLLRDFPHPVGSGFKHLLPRTSEHPECKAKSGFCFLAGDGRSSEQPGLAAIHTIFMREHNRLAEGLALRNSHWTDDEIFINARRILAAEFQHITYNEFLPRVLGWNAIYLYGLDLLSDGYFQGYDPKCNPTIVNEFATAAYRFGHSLLRPELKRMDEQYGDLEPSLRLRDVFFNPDHLYERGMIDELMRGFTTVSMETLDQFITEEVTNHLFEDKKVPFSGMDLASLNIQRGRDHGLAPYNEYRVLCNLTRARSFEDLSREVAPNNIQKLKSIYAHVDDIDLFTGGLAETPLHGGLVGPTFGCIIGIQFHHLRVCDRFWYENGDPLTRFTEAQLNEIRKTSLAKMVCENCDTIGLIQRSGFDLPDPFLNPRVPCKTLSTVNLDLWQERQSCQVNEVDIGLGGANRISPCVMCTCTKEGPVCQSLKIDNCFQLARGFSPENILHDHVCKVQCAFAFRAFPTVSSQAQNSLGFS
ncbi:unnamed protein product [Darwinula stevensoni]|uniref:Peroxidase n=1 Tax=Darwinula stevensoni TaxID=69355 RepID=A0A7R8ZYR8_9CRUS|nr:unnamed protein product [Darwinula stevensoni]CAG0882057.1 unnamed protein product [Darwinula stevensoni]